MPKGRPWTYVELRALARYRALGYKMYRIGRLLGRTRNAIVMASMYYLLSPKREERTWVPVLRKWWRKGLTDPQIAKKVGWARSCVTRRRVHLGLPRNHDPRSKWGDKMRALHARGYSDGEMAMALGLTRQNARQARRRLGLPPNKRSGRPNVPWSMCYRMKA